jgi:hypothetical protein
VFWYLFGWTSWRTLTIDLGWTWDHAEHWLTQRGIDALLPAARRRRAVTAGRGYPLTPRRSAPLAARVCRFFANPGACI